MKIPVLKIKNLIKRYNGAFILDIPHLEFQSGKIYGLVGPNGAGKTTLLNLLSLLDEPTKGEIFFEEQKVSCFSSLNIRRKMSMVMENPLLFHTTVFRNISAGLMCRSVDKKMWLQMVEKALTMVGLAGFEKRYAPDLSRGETQRVAVARALILKPEVLFLDEPFTNIDKQNINILEKLIVAVNNKYHTTIIFTTHDLLQACCLSNEVISLINGKIFEGSPENIFKGVVEEVNGSQLARISPDVSVSVVTEKRGEVHVSIAPQDIILSHSEILSSARNSLEGIVKRIQMEGQIVRISIFVNEGVEIIALITKTSYMDMDISIDSEIFLTFKANAVRVLD